VPVVVRSRDEDVVPAVVGCDDGGGRRRETATETATVPGGVGSERDDGDAVLGLIGAGMAEAGEGRLPNVVGNVDDGGRREEGGGRARGRRARGSGGAREGV
jgi:hypothetical protein